MSGKGEPEATLSMTWRSFLLVRPLSLASGVSWCLPMTGFTHLGLFHSFKQIHVNQKPGQGMRLEIFPRKNRASGRAQDDMIQVGSRHSPEGP